jgi:hypothetical protein
MYITKQNQYFLRQHVVCLKYYPNSPNIPHDSHLYLQLFSAAAATLRYCETALLSTGVIFPVFLCFSKKRHRRRTTEIYVCTLEEKG